MDDLDFHIFRPVALPTRFFGAPALPALLNIAFSTIVLLSILLLKLRINIAALVGTYFATMIGAHILLIQLGARDPHLTTLIQTLRISIRKPRGFGRARQKVYYP